MGKSSRVYWTMTPGSKLDFKVLSLAIFTVSTLMLFGTAQNAYAGGLNEIGFSEHVWSAGGSDDNWTNPDNWFDGNVPSNPSFAEIFIGCDFAPTPFGEGPAPTNVNAVLNTDQTVVDISGVDDFNLCEGSTLTINEERTLSFIPNVPRSPIFVSFTNFGTILNFGTLEVKNTLTWM